MSLKQIVGIVLIVVGIASLLWGGVFWTERETVVDAGPIEITAPNREGISIPPLAGGLALAGGVVLLLLPQRRRA